MVGWGGHTTNQTVADFDEFAFIQDSKAVLEASSSLADCCNFYSTVNGMGNSFATMAHTSGVRTMTLHWTISPIKNREWAIKERSKPKYIDESIWYQEQDCSFEKSTTARVFKGFKSAKREEFEWCHLQRGLDFEYDE